MAGPENRDASEAQRNADALKKLEELLASPKTQDAMADQVRNTGAATRAAEYRGSRWQFDRQAYENQSARNVQSQRISPEQGSRNSEAAREVGIQKVNDALSKLDALAKNFDARTGTFGTNDQNQNARMMNEVKMLLSTIKGAPIGPNDQFQIPKNAAKILNIPNHWNVNGSQIKMATSRVG